MIRRVFLRMVSAAGVAFAVGVEHFHPVSAGYTVELEGRELDVDVENQQYSVVLQALRSWNTAREDAIRLFGEDGAKQFWESEPTPLVRTNKISGGRVSALDIMRRELEDGQK